MSDQSAHVCIWAHMSYELHDKLGALKCSVFLSFIIVVVLCLCFIFNHMCMGVSLCVIVKVSEETKRKCCMP